jgi:UDP-N-acetylglucosamine:LPS N-acetylglucosamine transferase
MKLCLAASAGGHLSQMLAVADAYQGCQAFCVTSLEVGADKLRRFGPTHVVGECNRNQPLRTLGVTWKCLSLILRERPDVVFSTGAAPGLLLCIFGRMLGARVVWMDSIANSLKLSLSGRLVRPFAHLVLSQWPEVAARYPGVEYAGEVI